MAAQPPKQAYETHADTNSASVWVGDKEIVLEQGDRYETDDRVEQLALDAHPSVKKAAKAESKAKEDK